jgi:zinc protease
MVSLLFPNHPYGHLVSGDIQSLKKVALKDLKQLYQNQLKPMGATLAVSGDITMHELVKLLDSHFESWEGKPKQSLYRIE